MKTLIFNGSPRANGNTSFLIDRLIAGLNGEVRLVNAYQANIAPCFDCRYCWEHAGCCINDQMQQIYAYIKECDNIVIASPLNFSELTGKLLMVMSRLQMFYANKRFLKFDTVIKRKKGAIILCGGGEGGPDKAISTAKLLLKSMNALPVGEVLALHTDTLPCQYDEQALIKLNMLTADFNGNE